MIEIRRTVGIYGKCGEPVPLDRCRPGLIIYGQELLFTRGDGRAYRVSDGSEVLLKETKYGPDGPYDERYCEVEPLEVE